LGHPVYVAALLGRKIATPVDCTFALCASCN